MHPARRSSSQTRNSVNVRISPGNANVSCSCPVDSVVSHRVFLWRLHSRVLCICLSKSQLLIYPFVFHQYLLSASYPLKQSGGVTHFVSFFRGDGVNGRTRWHLYETFTREGESRRGRRKDPTSKEDVNGRWKEERGAKGRAQSNDKGRGEVII